ncbi:hypothetical protein L3Y34_003616 [Caenorhabditis briggsae]|nr:hypothetical protein L3Y34_003616 [Caenorhabditis briggsae]
MKLLLIFLTILLFFCSFSSGMYDKDTGVIGKRKFNRPGKPVKNGGVFNDVKVSEEKKKEMDQKSKDEKNHSFK